MKKTAFLLLVLALAAAGCKGRNARAHNAVKTETMAPAVSTTPDAAASSTDSITTQTVDVEDSRSVAEGDDTSSDETGTTAQTPAKKKAPASRKAHPAGRTR